MDYYFDSYKKVYRSSKFIGYGSEGVCYRKDNIVFKLFHDYYLDLIEERNFLKFKNINVDTYYFSKGKIFVNNKFKGLTMNFAKGKNMKEAIINEPFEKLLLATKKFESDTKIISDLNIKAYDLFFVNVLYDDVANRFNIVDCDDYLQRDTNSDKIYIENLQNLSDNLVRCIFDNRLLFHIKDSCILKELLKTSIDPINDIGMSAFLKENISPTELLCILKEEFSKLCSTEVTSVQDCLKLIKK